MIKRYKQQNKLQKFITHVTYVKYKKTDFERLGIQIYAPKIKLRTKIYILLIAISLIIPFTTAPLIAVGKWFK